MQNLSQGKTNNTRLFWPLWTAAEMAGAPTLRWGADHSCRCRGTWQHSESPPSSSTSTCCCWGLVMEQVQQQLKGLQPSHRPKVSVTQINTCHVGQCNVLPTSEWQRPWSANQHAQIRHTALSTASLTWQLRIIFFWRTLTHWRGQVDGAWVREKTR